jgi:hypothetical protein
MTAIETLSVLTGRSADQIESAKEQVRAGDLTPVKELLFDSALLLHGAAFSAVKMAHASIGFPDKNIRTALSAIEAVQKIFETLAKHDDKNRLSTISISLFQENLERITRYIARKGGRVMRHELLTSRVIQGTAIDYDRHLVALIDAGYLLEISTGRRKEIVYSLNLPDGPHLIEVQGTT